MSTAAQDLLACTDPTRAKALAARLERESGGEAWLIALAVIIRGLAERVERAEAQRKVMADGAIALGFELIEAHKAIAELQGMIGRSA